MSGNITVTDWEHQEHNIKFYGMNDINVHLSINSGEITKPKCNIAWIIKLYTGDQIKVSGSINVINLPFTINVNKTDDRIRVSAYYLHKMQVKTDSRNEINLELPLAIDIQSINHITIN